MIDLSWTIGEEREAELTEAPRPVLSTWHYLRSSLRRGWRTWVGLTVLGAVLGLAVVLVTPPGSTAKVTLLMGHPPSIDGPDGIAMDVSLLNTRTVSERTVDALGLALTPEAFRSAITADPVTSEVLSITVAGPDEAAAAARARELVRQYLDFRATQLRSMTSGLRTQYSSRVTSAQQQVTALTKQFEQLSSQGAAAQSRAYDTLARRTDLNKQIADWQEAIDNATLYTDAALETTHVIDPVQVDRASVKRAMALAVGSGLTAGAALGVGIVLFRALVTERLRRRQDVGVALGASVRFSVRSSGPAGRGGLRRWLPARGRWRGNDLATLARGLESALDPRDGMPGPAAAVPVEAPVTVAPNGRRSAAVSGQLSGSKVLSLTSERGDVPPGVDRERREPDGVALVAIGNVHAAADVVDAAAARLREGGATVLVVDLSRSGVLTDRAGGGGGAQAGGQADGRPAPAALRPTGIPELATGPRGGTPLGLVDLPGDTWRSAWESADAVLALLEVDPGIDVDHLATWVDRVVPLVTAGACTAELLSTTGDLVREAGLGLPFAMMVGCDTTDQSLGMVRPAETGPGLVGKP